MSSEQRREPNWRETESLEDAARRLIGVMDERNKRKVAGHLQAPAEIKDPACPLLEKRPEPSNDVGCVAQGSGQYTAGREGAGSDRATKGCGASGSEIGCGQVLTVGGGRPAEGVAVVAITCPLDAEVISGGFSVPVSNGNVHRKG